MSLPTKLSFPDFVQAAFTQKEQELRAWVEGLIEIASGLQQEAEQLKQQVARLKKARGHVN